MDKETLKKYLGKPVKFLVESKNKKYSQKDSGKNSVSRKEEGKLLSVTNRYAIFRLHDNGLEAWPVTEIERIEANEGHGKSLNFEEHIGRYLEFCPNKQNKGDIIKGELLSISNGNAIFGLPDFKLIAYPISEVIIVKIHDKNDFCSVGNAINYCDKLIKGQELKSKSNKDEQDWPGAINFFMESVTLGFMNDLNFDLLNSTVLNFLGFENSRLEFKENIKKRIEVLQKYRDFLSKLKPDQFGMLSDFQLNDVFSTIFKTGSQKYGESIIEVADKRVNDNNYTDSLVRTQLFFNKLQIRAINLKIRYEKTTDENQKELINTNITRIKNKIQYHKEKLERDLIEVPLNGESNDSSSPHRDSVKFAQSALDEIDKFRVLDDKTQIYYISLNRVLKNVGLALNADKKITSKPLVDKAIASAFELKKYINEYGLKPELIIETTWHLRLQLIACYVFKYTYMTDSPETRKEYRETIITDILPQKSADKKNIFATCPRVKLKPIADYLLSMGLEEEYLEISHILLDNSNYNETEKTPEYYKFKTHLECAKIFHRREDFGKFSDHFREADSLYSSIFNRLDDHETINLYKELRILNDTSAKTMVPFLYQLKKMKEDIDFRKYDVSVAQGFRDKFKELIQKYATKENKDAYLKLEMSHLVEFLLPYLDDEDYSQSKYLIGESMTLKSLELIKSTRNSINHDREQIKLGIRENLKNSFKKPLIIFAKNASLDRKDQKDYKKPFQSFMDDFEKNLQILSVLDGIELFKNIIESVKSEALLNPANHKFRSDRFIANLLKKNISLLLEKAGNLKWNDQKEFHDLLIINILKIILPNDSINKDMYDVGLTRILLYIAKNANYMPIDDRINRCEQAKNLCSDIFKENGKEIKSKDWTNCVVLLRELEQQKKLMFSLEGKNIDELRKIHNPMLVPSFLYFLNASPLKPLVHDIDNYSSGAYRTILEKMREDFDRYVTSITGNGYYIPESIYSLFNGFMNASENNGIKPWRNSKGEPSGWGFKKWQTWLDENPSTDPNGTVIPGDKCWIKEDIGEFNRMYRLRTEGLFQTFIKNVIKERTNYYKDIQTHKNEENQRDDYKSPEFKFMKSRCRLDFMTSIDTLKEIIYIICEDVAQRQSEMGISISYNFKGLTDKQEILVLKVSNDKSISNNSPEAFLEKLRNGGGRLYSIVKKCVGLCDYSIEANWMTTDGQTKAKRINILGDFEGANEINDMNSDPQGFVHIFTFYTDKDYNSFEKKYVIKKSNTK